MSGDATDYDQLMVWGYACKLFRDDEKAFHVDSGKHLIPWMADDKLMIDRYDGRGALYDLTSHEPVEGAWEDLSQEEKDTEMKCDTERYRALFEEEDTVTYKDEKLKRIYGKYGQVGYSYDDTGSVATCEPPTLDSTSKTFSPPSGLQLPPELVKPETMKQHAIITKTAAFISQQGSQMEILMRLKQQGNIKFNFLMHGDPLNEYYKFLLNLIKSGGYTPSDADTSCLDDEETDSEHYLHPSLIPSATTSADPKNPPALTRVIISKMVKYISKNGLIFEEAIKKLEDSRFSFLDSSDVYYNYYREQVMSSFKIEDSLPNNSEENKQEELQTPNDDTNEDELTKKAVKRKPTPVCFSLKKPKDTENLEVSTALPQEDSSDENDHGSSPEPPLPPPAPRISKSTKSSKQDKERYSSDNLQRERKAKVAQFLKDLKHK